MPPHTLWPARPGDNAPHQMPPRASPERTWTRAAVNEGVTWQAQLGHGRRHRKPPPCASNDPFEAAVKLMLRHKLQLCLTTCPSFGITGGPPGRQDGATKLDISSGTPPAAMPQGEGSRVVAEPRLAEPRLLPLRAACSDVGRLARVAVDISTCESKSTNHNATDLATS